MNEIIAYASSTRPNHLWSAAQFNSALPKNRVDADIPLVAKSEADDQHERLLGLQLLAWEWMAAHDCLKSGREYSLPRTTDKPKLVALIETLTAALVECEEHFDNRSDADCDQDGFIPNAEMRMLQPVREALAAAKMEGFE